MKPPIEFRPSRNRTAKPQGMAAKKLAATPGVVLKPVVVAAPDGAETLEGWKARALASEAELERRREKTRASVARARDKAKAKSDSGKIGKRGTSV